MSWFTNLSGIDESIGYEEVQNNFIVSGTRMTSIANGKTWEIGELDVVSLGLLQAIAAPFKKYGQLKVSAIRADIAKLHIDCEEHSLFQVASQCNLLEMSHYSVTPEDGVSRYEYDKTQGPACAISAGAATIYRNYLVLLNGSIGQTKHNQFNTLDDALKMIDPDNRARVENGYLLLDMSTLESINSAIKCVDTNSLKLSLKAGIHSGVEVTTDSSRKLVSQIFCSALPVAYNRETSVDSWEPFARLVLESQYEATLNAAVLNYAATGNNIVYLTMLGGGAFGNKQSWILDAINSTLSKFRGIDLDVRLVSFNNISTDIHKLVNYHATIQA